MSEAMNRFHPDLFSADEAAAYLHLDSAHTLEVCRRDYGLAGFKAGKGFVYWREDLDACALRIVGRDKPGAMRMAR